MDYILCRIKNYIKLLSGTRKIQLHKNLVNSTTISIDTLRCCLFSTYNLKFSYITNGKCLQYESSVISMVLWSYLIEAREMTPVTRVDKQ